MEIRLQKIIADAGLASRRAAEKLITFGKVRVNGKVVKELGSKADPEKDIITLSGKVIKPTKKKLYIMLYKPPGYVTTMKDPEGRPIVTDLLKGLNDRVYPVGRLDFDTQGLLLFTNDGETANKLTHPRHKVLKKYRVKVRGHLSKDQIAKLKLENKELGFRAPVDVYVEALPNAPKRPSKNSWIVITIAEGKNRQVRRMCDSVGATALKLTRVSFGNLTLKGLRPAEHRHLTAPEVEYLKGLG